eukprot:895768_1
MFPPHVYIVFVLVVSAAVACCFLAVFFYRRICKDEYEPCPCCTTLCCRCCHPSTPQDPIRMKIKCVSTATFTMYFVGAVLHGICNLLYLAGGNWFPFEILAFVAYISGLHFILIIFVYRLESFAGSALPGFAYLPSTIQRLRIGITILFLCYSPCNHLGLYAPQRRRCSKYHKGCDGLLVNLLCGDVDHPRNLVYAEDHSSFKARIESSQRASPIK